MKKKIIISSILAIVALLTVFGIFYKIKSSANKHADKYYAQGMDLYKQEKYQDAFYNFQQIKSTSNLYTLALLKQFQCANKLNDTKTMTSKLDLLTKRKTGEIIRPYILYNELNYNETTSKYSANQLLKRYTYIQTKYPKSDFAKASYYKIAKLLETQNPYEAKNNYVKYLEYAPNGKYSTLALNSLTKLHVKLTSQDIKIVAESHIKNSNYNDAYKLLKDAPFEDNWYNLATVYKALKAPNLEKETILKALALKNTSVEEKDISKAIERLLVLTNANKIQTLQDMYVKYQATAAYPTIVYKLSESLTSIRSIKLYEYIINNHPNSYWASNSLWEAFWYNYKQKRFKTCIKLATSHQNLYPNAKDAPRLLYWKGKALYNERRQKEAKEVFEKVIKDYPISYYAFLSSRQLKISKANKLINKKLVQKYDIDSISKNLFNDDILLLSLVNYNDFETIEEFKIDDEFIKSWIYNKKQMYPESIKTAQDALENANNIGFSDYRLKLIYPVRFEKLINKYAFKYKISPYLFLSLVREESHFNPDAKSPVGALGLSQIMPSTATHIEGKTVSKQELMDVENNIRIGEKYFNYITQHFNGNVYLAILSYNAGFGNVEKWLNDSNISAKEIDEFVENVPFSETKNYIKKILTSYWTYQNIYSSRY